MNNLINVKNHDTPRSLGGNCFCVWDRFGGVAPRALLLGCARLLYPLLILGLLSVNLVMTACEWLTLLWQGYTRFKTRSRYEIV